MTATVSLGTPVRVARDLNASGRWTVYARVGGRWKPVLKTDALRIEGVTWAVSSAAVERIRTPKDGFTSTGARGLGKRTVCAFACGTLAALTATPNGGDRVTFNPHRDDCFKVAGADAPDALPALVFTPGGVVEVGA